MDFKKSIPVAHSIIISLILLLIHKSIFYFFFPDTEANFHFSLLELYTFFATCSIIITAISIIVKNTSINSVGQVFLLTTFVQIMICFAVFYKPLNAEGTFIKMEKANFLIVFLLFLAIETILTVRLLNKNQ